MIKKLLFLLLMLAAPAVALAQCQEQFALGWAHSMSIKEDGTLWGWGRNLNGPLGDGTTTDRSTPVQIGTDLWSVITANESHSIGIKQDGTLWSWGSNFSGVLGNGTMYDGSNIPVQVGTDNHWLKLSAGPFHTLAIKDDGTLWAWGNNQSYGLGDGTNEVRLTPIQIGTDTNWDQIAAGYGFSAALKSDGTRWAWGANYYGMLGNGSLTSVTVPTQIGLDTDWVYLSMGHTHGAAIKADGSLWMWGRNNDGQVGNGTTTDVTTPYQIPAENGWKQAIAYVEHTMAIKNDGTLYTWGDNDDFISSATPVQTGSSDTWNSIYSGGNHYLGVQTTGNYLTWGFNYYGQLGDGTTNQNNTPTVMGCALLGTAPQADYASTVKVYPNPANTLLEVETATASITRAHIYDLTGKRLLTQNGHGTHCTFNVSLLSAAVYLITIETNNGSKHLKFVKN